MRILFTFIGGLGHFHPLVPLAQEATAVGHDVAVACSGGLVSRVEAAGFEVFATSPVPSVLGESTVSVAPKRDLSRLVSVDRVAAEVEFATNFGDKGARRHATAVQDVIRAWHPDIVVRDEADFGSAIAAEVLGVPTVTVLVLAAGMLARPDLLTAPLNALREEHGLAPDPELSMLTAGVVLAPFPLSFRSPSSPVALPASTLAYRTGLQVVGKTMSRPTDATGRRVYATLGTVFNTESGDLLERLVAALADVDADALVTVGTDIDPSQLGPRPDRVRVERFVPQDEVLRVSDLVVSHGGSGSLIATIAHGLPSVLLPLGADQPHNAARAEELGLARSLDAAHATPADIALAVTRVLDDAQIANRVRAMAREMSDLPGTGEAVRRILTAPEA